MSLLYPSIILPHVLSRTETQTRTHTTSPVDIAISSSLLPIQEGAGQRGRLPITVGVILMRRMDTRMGTRTTQMGMQTGEGKRYCRTSIPTSTLISSTILPLVHLAAILRPVTSASTETTSLYIRLRWACTSGSLWRETRTSERAR